MRTDRFRRFFARLRDGGADRPRTGHGGLDSDDSAWSARRVSSSTLASETGIAAGAPVAGGGQVARERRAAPARVDNGLRGSTGDPPSSTFMPLQMLGHYCIIGKIGEGGMGQVWRAADTQLDRDVAIKRLPVEWLSDPARLARFRTEAKVLATLNHPNIVTIHTVHEEDGVPFIVMELVSGTPLRECLPTSGLPMSLLLDYAIPIADALASAHERGVVHRDIKPENIMLSDEGRIKVLDFGIAKRSSLLEDDTWQTYPVGIGRDSSLVGTLPYMSPEQLSGDGVGPQSDVFSLGILLFEMAVGERPFTGKSPRELATAILGQPAQPPSDARADLPRSFDEIVQDCLRKAPDERPSTARPVVERLRELSQNRGRVAMEALTLANRNAEEMGSLPDEPGSPPARRIAVMPFLDSSETGEDAYLCSCLSNDVAMALSRAPGVSATPVSRPAPETLSAVEMARLLGADMVVEGRLTRIDGRLRVSVSVSPVDDSSVDWSATLDRELDESSVVHDHVAEVVSRLLHVRTEPRSTRRDVIDPRSRVALQKGRYFWGQRYEGGLRRALECFAEAATLDPNNAAAHVGIADCHVLLGHFGILDPAPAYETAVASARLALEIDPFRADVHTNLAWIASFRDRDTVEAEARFRTALELDSSYATAWEWYGLHLLSQRRSGEAIDALRRAHQADPLSLMINSILGWALYTVREHREAMHLLNNVLEMDARFVFAHLLLAIQLARAESFESAVSLAERGAILSGRNGFSLAVLAYVYGRAGRLEDCDRSVDDLQSGVDGRYVSPLHLALGRLGAARCDEALDHLERSVELRESFLVTMYVDPVFDVVRQSARFRGIVDMMRPNLESSTLDGANA